MALKEWNELPYTVRMSKRRLYEYIKSEIESSGTSTPSSEPDEAEDEMV